MIAFGASDMTKAYVGSTEVSKAYLGDELVWGGSSPVLPYDARIEYLQGTGTSTWIDTGFIPQQDNIRVIADVEIVTVANNNIFYCMYASSTPKLNQNWTNSGNTIYFRCNSYDKSFSTTKERHVFENGTSIKIDGVVKATPTFTKTFANNTAHLVLYGNPNAAVPTSISSTSAFKGKIYEFSVYYGDALQLHYIPVRVGTTGYMYDIVSGNLFGNSGTGNFILGSDVS